jgi:hypothetical protein
MDESQASTPSMEAVIAALEGDKVLRAAVAKKLAADFPQDYLAHVVVDHSALSDISSRFISSNKEWQE